MSAYGAPESSPDNNIDPTGAAAIGRLKAKLEVLKGGMEFYFTSNLPYAERLEYGWSEQAPAGMVRVSVASWQSIVEDEIRKAK